MNASTLVVISPHQARDAGLPNRPSSLISAFLAARAFREVLVVNRLRPSAFLQGLPGARPMTGGGLVGLRRTLANGAVVVEHPWPFGRLERRFLHGLLTVSASRSAGEVVVWVADPKSVTAVIGTGRDRVPWRVVVDAYDAWDRSPLVRGERRVQAASEGYVAAAASADLVFANTTLMRDRLASLGARDARLLPNACPAVDAADGGAGPRREGLLYVGRIHERFATELAGAVADALPDTIVTIAGPVEREPDGWTALRARSNVHIRGRTEGGAARQMMRTAAALIVPHRVDDYTRSQDAMKAWDAIASGTPVISTRIPPAADWPRGLAEVCDDVESFVAAARCAVNDGLAAGRADRLAFAASNEWSDRAAEAVAAIQSLTSARDAERT